MSCIERSLDVWETTGTLARFVYAQAIGGQSPNSQRRAGLLLGFATKRTYLFGNYEVHGAHLITAHCDKFLPRRW